MHYLVGVSHLTKYGTNRPLIVLREIGDIFAYAKDREYDV